MLPSMTMLRIERLLLFIIACLMAIGQANTVASLAVQESKIDWRPYVKELQLKIRRYWMPPFSNRKSHIVVAWKIHTNGTISNLIIEKHGLRQDENEAALNAVRASAPFEPLPKGADQVCDIEYTFDYDGKSVPLGLSVGNSTVQSGFKQSRKRQEETTEMGSWFI
jgi:hypothetical protein